MGSVSNAISTARVVPISYFFPQPVASRGYPIMGNEAKNLSQITFQSSEKEVLQRHEGLIRSMALSFVNKGVEVDDLLQEGRTALLTSFRTWERSDIQFWSYARRAVFGAMCDFVTKEVGEPSHPFVDDSEMLETVADEILNIEDALISKQSIQIILARMSSLSELERRIIRMRFHEDMKLEAIADAVGHDRKTVSKVLDKALSTLREHLEADGGWS